MRKQENSGFTLVEILVALGGLAILALIVGQIVSDVSRSTKQRQLSLARDQAALWARTAAGSLQSLTGSLKQSGNTPFYNCVCGKGCTSGQFNPLTLYDPSTPLPTPVPAYYDSWGVPCTSPTASNCVISVSFTFVAQCPPGLPSAAPFPTFTCTQPVEFFGIMFTVQPNASSSVQANSFKPVNGIVFTQVAALNPPGSGVCP